MSDSRDMALGRLLSEGAVPDHADGYWSGTRQAVAPELKRLERRGRGRRRRVLQVAIATTVAAVAAAVVLVVLPSLRGPSVASATAADMLASMNMASAQSPRTVRMSFTLEGRPADGEPGGTGEPSTTLMLTLSAAGDSRYSVVSPPAYKARSSAQVITYDARRHEARSINGTVPLSSAEDLMIARPAWDSGLSDLGLRYLTALSGWVRSRLAEADLGAQVTRTSYLGRPAWHAVLRERLTHPDRTATWTVTVDRQTGLVLHSELEVRSVGPSPAAPTVEEFRVTRFEVDPALEQGWNSIAEAGRERIGVIDDATRFGTPDQVARRCSPTPVLIPDWVPKGYRLTDVATRGHPGIGRSREGKDRLVYLSRHHPRKYILRRIGIDPATQHVGVRFRRGFSAFEITVLPPRGSGGERAKLELPDSELVTLRRGYLAGEKARVGTAPYMGLGPTLVTQIDGYRITITGDLTRDELVGVAESIKRR